MKQRFSVLCCSIIFLGLILVAANSSLSAPNDNAQEVGLWISNGPRGGRALALEASPGFSDDGVAFSGE